MIEAKFFPREILSKTEKALFGRHVLIIVGSRRSGKTSLLYLLRDKLVTKYKVPIANILYYDLENIVFRETFQIKDFDLVARELTAKAGDSSKKVYVLLDEIQYLDNPAGLLKYVHDHYPKLKFLVSGSSSLKIKEKFSDSMVGRKKVFLLHPLSFKEFLLFKKKDHLIKSLPEIDSLKKLKKLKSFNLTPSTSRELDDLVFEFLICGGYPEVALVSKLAEKRDILSEIYSSYLQKDIKYIFDIENIEKFNKLIKLYASQIGNLVNFSEISNTLGLSRNTIDKYSFIQESTFLINFLKPYYSNVRKELTRMPKIYFEDNGLRNAVLDSFQKKFERMDIGALAENFIYNQLQKKDFEQIHFWRTKTKVEVDFIIKIKNELIPIEVKYKSFIKPQIPSSLSAFIRKYHSSTAIVITKNLFARKRVNKVDVFWLPIYLL